MANEKMAASYDMVVVCGASIGGLIQCISGFLNERGVTIHEIVKEIGPGESISFDSNSVVFISPPEGESGRMAISTWASELGIDYRQWYLENPMAAYLSRTLSPVVTLWTLKAGVVAGYSVWMDGRKCEWNTVGARREVGAAENEAPSSEHLADLLGDKEFDYGCFMEGHRDYEIATGILASRLGLRAHLVDIMDLIDGEGAMAISEGEYTTVDLTHWTAIAFESMP